MLKIDHIAVWVKDLEIMRSFYEKYFGLSSGNKYLNESKGFSSYFLSFPESDTRIELMYKKSIPDHRFESEAIGITHIAISVGSKEKVDKLTEILRTDGYSILGEPRTTGDGYYESVITDPEGNRIEITI